ncbi:MAG: hypothetical protein K2I69_01520 [Muribaculaceae bacterium]|nr:hypothetical protein [Muribaculaceae bacterium]
MRKKVFFLVLLLPVLLCQCGGTERVSPELHSILTADESNMYALAGDTAPDGGCLRMRSRRLSGPFSRVFNDSNHVHLAQAKAGGIVPISGPQEAWTNTQGIVKVVSDSTIFIDSLTHSYAYLKPHAAELLHEIGTRFRDSLAARGGGDYRLKVTSLLRTDGTVGRLRRVNRNASSESAHCYATTFDISYSKFICDNAAGTRRSFEDLKNLLAEIVDDLHSEGRCLVKHERRQACFHITATVSEKCEKP